MRTTVQYRFRELKPDQSENEIKKTKQTQTKERKLVNFKTVAIYFAS